MFAKTREAPSVVSTRVLRTHRLNEVENFRLHGKIRTIDNEIQSNYSQLSDEIDGVRKNLNRIKKLKNNLGVSVERRKLLRERGVFVLPSSGLDDDEGVTLRRSDGKTVIIRGKECYDGEVIRRYVDINLDYSQVSISDSVAEEDNDEDNEQLTLGDKFKDKEKVFHYRMIMPPLRPGSRRNFKDYEEEENDESLELDLPPSEEYLSSLRSSPFRFKSKNLNTRRDSKQATKKPKGQPDLNRENKIHTSANHELVDVEDELKTEVKNVESTNVAQPNPSPVASSPKPNQSIVIKGSVRPKTASELIPKRLKSGRRSCESASVIPNSPNQKIKNMSKETEPYKVKNTFLQNPVTKAIKGKSDATMTPTNQKLLDRRPSVEDVVKIQITKPIPVLTEDETISEQKYTVNEERQDPLDSESGDEFRDDVCWTEQITRTTLAPIHDTSSSKHLTKNHRRRQSRTRARTMSICSNLDENQSTISYSSRYSVRRTESFNSNANSTSTAAKSRKKSCVTFAESERKLQLSNDEIIYDARPEKALSKGYTTMQMTIRGKQVRICVPKFSKDDVIDRAMAKTAAKMADERTRGNINGPGAKQQKQTKHLIMS